MSSLVMRHSVLTIIFHLHELTRCLTIVCRSAGGGPVPQERPHWTTAPPTGEVGRWRGPVCRVGARRLQRPRCRQSPQDLPGRTARTTAD